MSSGLMHHVPPAALAEFFAAHPGWVADERSRPPRGIADERSRPPRGMIGWPTHKTGKPSVRFT